jgi:hypothetical protein
MAREIGDGPGAVPGGELPEGEQKRDPPVHALGAVAFPGQPGYVTLDLRPDPRGPDPVDGLRLDEIVLQHRATSLLDAMGWMIHLR